MGVGSTGIAAKNTERAFIGIELDEVYFQKASSRLGFPTASKSPMTPEGAPSVGALLAVNVMLKGLYKLHFNLFWL